MTKNEIIVVKSIDFDKTYSPHDYNINGKKITKYFPIPLTADVLVNCGFDLAKGSESDYCFIIQEDDGVSNEFLLWIDIGEYRKSPLVSIVGEENDWLYTKIQYYHELQNLFYSLTGYSLDNIKTNTL